MMRPSNSGLTGPSGLAAAMPATAAAAAGAADDGERHVGSEVMVEHEGETFHAVVTQYFPPDDNDSEVPRSSDHSIQSTMVVSGNAYARSSDVRDVQRPYVVTTQSNAAPAISPIIRAALAHRALG